MRDSQKGITTREAVLGTIFILLGFFCALYFFKHYTRPKRDIAASLRSLVIQPETKSVPRKQEAKKEESLEEALDISLLEEETEPEPIEEEAVEKDVIPDLILNGIFSSETGNYALINNRIVRIGDTILGVKVKEISSENVILDAFGKEVILKVD